MNFWATSSTKFRTAEYSQRLAGVHKRKSDRDWKLGHVLLKGRLQQEQLAHLPGTQIGYGVIFAMYCAMPETDDTSEAVIPPNEYGVYSTK